MKSVVDDKGSFTVEVSLLSIFIVMIIMNIIVLICIMYDKCIIYEEINRNIIIINEQKEKVEIANLEGDFKINNKLLCIKVLDISYKLDEDSINVSVNYRMKYNNMGLIRNKKSYVINKKIYLFDVKRYIRSA